ncbi:MAG: hypothetical protein WC565_03050 [Parcubacteria group bacterium]
MTIESTTTYICDGCGASSSSHDNWKVLIDVYRVTNGAQGDLICPACVARVLGKPTASFVCDTCWNRIELSPGSIHACPGCFECGRSAGHNRRCSRKRK